MLGSVRGRLSSCFLGREGGGGAGNTTGSTCMVCRGRFLLGCTAVVLVSKVGQAKNTLATKIMISHTCLSPFPSPATLNPKPSSFITYILKAQNPNPTP